jgi:hypothetical protein
VYGSLSKILKIAECQGLMPVILPTQEADIRKIMVQIQPGQIVHETLSQNDLHKYRASEVAQGEGPDFKPQYPTKKLNCYKIQ